MSLISILLLGIINREPLNAYEIIRRLERYRIESWLKSSESTIYLNLRKLNKNGLTEIVNEKDGNMPEKKVHIITEAGKKVFYQEMENLVKDVSYDFNRFSVAQLFIDTIDTNDQVEWLKGRKKNIFNYIKNLEYQLEILKKEENIGNYICIVKRYINFMNMELDSINDLTIF